MDTVDVAAVTKIVKMVGAEFKEVSDDDIGFWIELQAPVISRKKFGTDYNLALALLVCHAMTTRWGQFPIRDGLLAYQRAE